MRWPRPGRLRAPLELAAGRMADGMEALGLRTIGELLEHLPRASREARVVRDLRAGEGATVAVQVRTIRARPVRRRGMKPLVEATVFDGTGSMRATFFNQPWLVQRYRPGTRLVLHGKTTARGGPTSPITPSVRNLMPVRRGSRARSPTTPRPRESPRHRSSPSCRARGRSDGRAGGAAIPANRVTERCPTERARSRRSTSPERGRPRDRAHQTGVRGAAADPARVPAPPREAASAQRRARPGWAAIA